ncbi:MAG: ribonuclease H family protein [Paraglaciecola polaris]|uniref:ribonuclease H family protein n=1 Tax=Paraglaciecola polaris TaxID=222814 RepID=UPI0030032CEB
MKFYVVWKGRETGIFTDWNTCKKQIHQFKGASYKSFKTRSEAESALHSDKKLTASNTSKLPVAKSTSKKEVIKTYTAEDISLINVNTKIYTDGGCVPNPGEAGSGLAVYRNESLCELWYGLYNPNGTNNTAELNALHQALLMARDELSNGRTVAIFCDSQYSIQCITQWAVKWSKNGWKKKTGEIKNLEIIKEMFAIHQSIKEDVEIRHVNGHVDLEGNELADRMTMLAIELADKDFTSYREDLDIKQILNMRSG